MAKGIDKMTKLRSAAKARGTSLLSAEDGSATIETVIWLPILCTLLAMVMNLSLVFFNESEMLRIVQDANRAFSLGRFEETIEVQDYVVTQLAHLNADITVVTTKIDSAAGGVIHTDASVSAADLMPLNFMRAPFEGIEIVVNAQHLIEF